MIIVLLGAAGFVGRAAAVELARRPEVGEIILVDYVVRDAKKMAKTLSPKCRYAMADVGKPAELTRLLEGVDAVANAAGPCWEYEKATLLACASMKIPVASIGDNTLSREDRNEIHDAFRRAGTCRGLRVRDDARVDRPARRALPGAAGSPRRALPGTCSSRPTCSAGTRSCATSRSGSDPIRPARRGPRRPVLRDAGRHDRRGAGAESGIAGRRDREHAGQDGDHREGIRRRDDAVAAGDDVGAPGDARRGRRRRRRDADRPRRRPAGKIASVLLSETAVRLASRSLEEKGLLPIHEVIGREAARAIAEDAGAVIISG